MIKSYIVKSGQNIFDVAIMLHGSIEGVFDLLLSNDELTFNTQLIAGTPLKYHTEFTINDSVAKWFSTNDITVRNGHHKVDSASIPSIFLLWLYSFHPQEYDTLMFQSEEDRTTYLNKFFLPRMIIRHSGVDCNIPVWVYTNKYLVIDWGDCSSPQIVEHTEDEIELVHCYNSGDEHIIKFYGNFDFYTIDLSAINGIYYLLDSIYADNFVANTNINELQSLFHQ